VHALQPRYPVDRLDFCNYYLQPIHHGKIDPELTFLLKKLDFYMNGHVNTQNNRYWCTESLHLLHKSPHNNVLCPERKENYWSYTFYGHNSKRCVRYILQPFFTHLTDEEKLYGHFQKDSATALTAKHSMQALHEVSDDVVTSHGLWPSCSPEINPCGCFLWGYLKKKFMPTIHT
jgi:hypothetical protein